MNKYFIRYETRFWNTYPKRSIILEIEDDNLDIYRIEEIIRKIHSCEYPVEILYMNKL